MNIKAFDVIVVGSGTSAYYSLTGLLQSSDLRIAIVDERPYGGTCALRGCQPKKYLVSNAKAVAAVSHLLGKGLEGQVRTNWEALQGLKNDFLHGKPEADLAHWQSLGVSTYTGHARMIDENRIDVEGKVLTGRTIILATGSLPNHLPIEGSEFARDSEYFLNLPHLPKRIVFIGGGFVSFEFAHVAIRTGASKVLIINRSARPLKSFEGDLVDTLLKASTDAGIEMLLGTVPERIVKTGKGYVVHYSSGEECETDLVIDATGRLPNLAVLEGEHGGVTHSSKGVAVNEYLQSISNPAVYAIGDCADTPYMLATVADKEGQTVAMNILHGNKHSVDYSIVPNAVFTTPTLASVGLTEIEAQARQLDFRVNQGETTGWPSSKRIGEEHGAYKVLIENGSELILGAHLIRHNAAEVINLFALAMKGNIPASELADLMWAYPTSTSDLKYMVR
jgi:glutathione reductase (NADPH)